MAFYLTVCDKKKYIYIYIQVNGRGGNLTSGSAAVWVGGSKLSQMWSVRARAVAVDSDSTLKWQRQALKGIDGGPVNNPAAQMDHVGGQGQQILEKSGQEFSMRL